MVSILTFEMFKFSLRTVYYGLFGLCLSSYGFWVGFNSLKHSSDPIIIGTSCEKIILNSNLTHLGKGCTIKPAAAAAKGEMMMRRIFPVEGQWHYTEYAYLWEIKNDILVKETIVPNCIKLTVCSAGSNNYQDGTIWINFEKNYDFQIKCSSKNSLKKFAACKPELTSEIGNDYKVAIKCFPKSEDECPLEYTLAVCAIGIGWFTLALCWWWEHTSLQMLRRVRIRQNTWLHIDRRRG